MAYSRWIKPEVYPLLFPTGVAIGACVTQLVRNIWTNPEVRVTKESRAAGVLENFEEGERYKENALRRLVRDRSREINKEYIKCSQ